MNSTKTGKKKPGKLVWCGRGEGGGSTGVNLVTNPVISNEQGKDLIVVKKTRNGTYPWSFGTQISRIG